MAKVAGKTGSVTYSGGAIAGINAWTLDYKAATEETTDFAAVGVETHIPTTTGWSGSFEGFKDGAPKAIGSEIAFTFLESTTSGQVWSGQAIITGIAAATSAKGIATYKYSIIGTGVLTVPTA